MSALLLAACHRVAAPDTGAPESDTKSADVGKNAAEGVTLTATEIEKMGVQVQHPRSLRHLAEVGGFGVVLAHDTVAQAVTDLSTAQATARLSRTALQRALKLQGTPGAVSADVVDTAEQRADIDAATLLLARQKLTAVLGMNPPWTTNEEGRTLTALSNGKTKLVRATFPTASLAGGTPTRLRATRIGAGKPDWPLGPVWEAPADPNIPGRSFFALFSSSDAGEGERLQVWAPIGAAQNGVVIPASAAVMSEGRYWCYVQRQPRNFVKTAIDTDQPTANGYFVTSGIAVGDQIVTAAAAQLLAIESASAAQPD